jgi:hypothetical protein
MLEAQVLNRIIPSGPQTCSTKKSIPIPQKQNTPKYRNIAQLGSPVVNFCVRLPNYLLYAHEYDSPEKLVPIPLLNEQEAKYFRTSLASGPLAVSKRSTMWLLSPRSH